MGAIIREGYALTADERSITNALADKRRWGDIPLTREEYICLKEKLAGGVERFGWNDLCKYFPVCVTTYTVFRAKYEYGEAYFWTFLFTGIGLKTDAFKEKYLGMLVMRQFERFNFNYSGEKDPKKKALAAIVKQAGKIVGEGAELRKASMAQTVKKTTVKAQQTSNPVKDENEAASAAAMTKQERLDMIRDLLAKDTTEEAFLQALKEKRLFLFARGSEDAPELEAKAKPLAGDLAMMLRMGSMASIVSTVWVEEYKEIIGATMLVKMLTVPGEMDREKLGQERKLFLMEKPSRVRVRMIFDQDPLEDGVNEQQKDLMERAIKAHWNAIYENFSIMAKDEYYHDIFMRYSETLELIYKKSKIEGRPYDTFFQYLLMEKMAVLLSLLPDNTPGNRQAIREGMAVTTQTYDIFPEMLRRDIILCSTFIFLYGKEVGKK